MQERRFIDTRTGRFVGDHGTALQAIEFAIAGHNAAWTQEVEFLKAWREGDLAEWPEYYEWLTTQEQP